MTYIPKYIMKKGNVEYEMGASIREVKEGDVIKTADGRLETIVEVSDLETIRSGHYKVRTESGTYYPMEVAAYGKKIK